MSKISIGLPVLIGDETLLTAQQIFDLSAEQVSTLSTSTLANMTRDKLYKPHGVPSGWNPGSIWQSSSNNYGLGANAVGLSVTQVEALGTHISFLGKEAIAALSLNVIRSLTIAQIQALTSDQIGEWVKDTSSSNYIWDMPDVPGGLTAAQIGAFSPLQIGALSASAVSGLTAAQIGAFSSLQIGALSASTVAGFTTAQIGTFSLTQIGALSEITVSGLTTAQIGAFNLVQIGALSASALSEFTTSQIGAFSLEKFRALTPMQVNALSAKLSAAQIFNLTAQQVSALSTTALRSMTRAQLYKPYGVPSGWIPYWSWRSSSNNYGLGVNAAGLTAIQVQALDTNISFLGKEAIAALSLDVIRSLTVAQIQALTSDQISQGVKDTSSSNYIWDTPDVSRGLTAAQIGELNAMQIGAFSLVQMGVLTATQISALSANGMAGLTATQIRALTPVQIGALSTLQIGTLNFVQIGAFSLAQINTFSLAQIRALNPMQVNALSAKFLATQIFKLTTQQISDLSTTALMSMTQDQLYKPYGLPSRWDSNWSWKSSWNNYGLGVNAAGLTVTQVKALDAHISFLGKEAVAALSLDVIRSLTIMQIQALTFDQISQGVKDTTKNYYNWDTPDVPRGLTAIQIGVLSTAQIGALSTVQISALSANAVSGLTAAQIAALSTAQIGALSVDGLSGLTAAQIGALSANAVSGLTAAQIAALSIAQIGALSADGLSGLTVAQISALSAAQVGALSANSVNGLTAAQIGALSPTQIILGSAIDTENILYSDAASESLQKFWFTKHVLGHVLSGATPGNDTLVMPTASSDVKILDGGLGADLLRGGAGNDTYQFDLSTAFGDDVVSDLPGNVASTKDSILLLGSFIDTNAETSADKDQYNLLFRRDGSDLYIYDMQYYNVSRLSRIKVSNHFESLNKIETIRILTKGGKYTSISSAGIDNLVQAMAGIFLSIGQTGSNVLSTPEIVNAINANWKTNSFLG